MSSPESLEQVPSTLDDGAAVGVGLLPQTPWWPAGRPEQPLAARRPPNHRVAAPAAAARPPKE